MCGKIVNDFLVNLSISSSDVAVFKSSFAFFDCDARISTVLRFSRGALPSKIWTGTILYEKHDAHISVIIFKCGLCTFK